MHVRTSGWEQKMQSSDVPEDIELGEIRPWETVVSTVCPGQI